MPWAGLLSGILAVETEAENLGTLQDTVGI
jgi:hypothetical protein